MASGPLCSLGNAKTIRHDHIESPSPPTRQIRRQHWIADCADLCECHSDRAPFCFHAKLKRGSEIRQNQPNPRPPMLQPYREYRRRSDAASPTQSHRQSRAAAARSLWFRRRPLTATVAGHIAFLRVRTVRVERFALIRPLLRVVVPRDNCPVAQRGGVRGGNQRWPIRRA